MTGGAIGRFRGSFAGALPHRRKQLPLLRRQIQNPGKLLYRQTIVHRGIDPGRLNVIAEIPHNFRTIAIFLPVLRRQRIVQHLRPALMIGGGYDGHRFYLLAAKDFKGVDRVLCRVQRPLINVDPGGVDPTDIYEILPHQTGFRVSVRIVLPCRTA